MKTANELQASVSRLIAGHYVRPQMYVGTISSAASAEMLEAVLHQAHWFWCEVVDRHADCQRLLAEAREAAKCGPYWFASAFRMKNPDATHEAASRYVLDQWKGISIKLGVNLGDPVARESHRPHGEPAG